MTHRPGVGLYDEPIDRECWTHPGLTASLLFISGVCALWWAGSLLAWPVWLATQRHAPGMADGAWGLGDGR